PTRGVQASPLSPRGTRLPAAACTYLFHVVANENPSDERLIALAEVRDVTPQLDEAGEMIGVPAIERTLAACLDGIRRVQTQRGAPATRKPRRGSCRGASCGGLCLWHRRR